jgi:iron complex outermembrane receptor protein
MTRLHAPLHLPLTLVALAATTWAPDARAQAADPGAAPERIEITARKRSEPLQEVPVAARTFSAQALADENIIDLRSLAARTASASTVELGASFASEVVLRGTGAGRAVNAETATGLYRNGAYAAGGNIGGRAFNKMDFFDVQRIEVMRGPQGALFGRGAVGGAMNILNVRPQGTATRSVTLTGGNNEALGVEAILNQPLDEGMALRAGLKSSSTKGGTFNDAGTGAALDQERFDGARVSLALTRPVASYFLLVDGYSEAGPSFGVNQFVIAQPETRFTRTFNTPARYWRKESTAIGEANWDLGSMSLVALTQLKRREGFTADDFDRFNNIAATNANLQSWQRLSTDKMSRIGQELRLQGDSVAPWQWLVGIEALKLEDTFTVDLNGAIARARPNNSLNTTESTDTSLGVFGLLGYDITPKLNLTAELRQQNDRKKFTLVSTTNTFPTGTPPALQDSGPVNTSTLTQDYDRKFDGLAKVVALTWKPTSAYTGYVRYGEAYRPGGFNNDPDRNTATSTPPGPRFSIPYEQERARSWELGAKTEWFDRALRLNAAAYQTKMDDILLNNSVSSAPPGSSTSRVIQFVENGGAARLDGFELDMRIELPAPGPGARLIIDGSANLTNTRITSGRFNGADVPQTRAKSGTLGVTYEFRLPGVTRAFVNLNTQQLRGGFQDPSNAIPMDPVELLNLNLGARGEKWSVSLNVANLNDYAYITNYNNAQRTTGYVNLPRSWSLRAAVNF